MKGAVLSAGAILAVIALQLSSPFSVGAETLTEIVDYSLQHNAELQELREGKGLREAGKTRAGARRNPLLSFEGGTGSATGSDDNILSLGLSQEFLTAGKRAKRLTVADGELEVFSWQLAERERTLRAEVKEACYDAVLAANRVELAKRGAELSRQLLDVAAERLAAGDIPELEMNLAKVELARSQGAMIEVDNALTQSRARVQALMGLPAGSTITPMINPDVPAALSKTPAELKRLARAQRPDLKALEAQKKRSENELILARAEGVPDVTAGVALNRETTVMEIGGARGKDTSYTVNFRISVPIPVFDKNRAGAQEALAHISSAESRLASTGALIEREVETAYAAYINADKVLALYRGGILPQLEENLKLTQEAYRLGEMPILNVIQEQKKFVEVHQDYLKAVHDRQTALVKLECAVATELSGGSQ